MNQISQGQYSKNIEKHHVVVIPQRKRRLYSRYLQENLYLIQLIQSSTITNSSESSNFIQIKRHLHQMRFYGLYIDHRAQRFCCKRENTRILSDLIWTNPLIHLENILLLLPLSLSKNTSIHIQNSCFQSVSCNMSSSFHSAFSSIEYKWQSSHYILEAEIPSYLHPEMLVRMLGFHFKDIAFIDLLRRTLHIHSIQLEHPNAYMKHSISKSLTTIVWNLWTLEFENFVTNEFRSVLYQLTSFYRYGQNSFSFLRKLYFMNLQVVSRNINFDKHILQNIIGNLSLMKMELLFAKTCNYLRYANNWIIGMETNILVMQALKRRCIRFWRYRIGIFIRSSRLQIINLYKHDSWFLGSIFQFKFNEMNVKVMSANSLVLPLTCFKKKRVFIMIPIVSLVNLLSKYGFCNSIGYPISKASWSTWPDSEIIKRFNQILISISCHYSGCKNKKYLGYIQYILCFSCGKTLACKHKTNLKSIWHTYADQLARSYFSSEKIDTLNLGFLTKINKMFIRHKRIVTWDLKNIYPDPMVLLLINKVYKKTIF